MRWLRVCKTFVHIGAECARRPVHVGGPARWCWVCKGSVHVGG